MLIYLLAIIATSNARRLPDIYWNSTNQIFDISNTDHVMSVKLLDRVTIVCPTPNPYAPYEYSKLYAVSPEGYETCELQQEKLLGVCQSEGQQSSISIVFRDFSPLPGAMEFRPGRSYFFISTSDGTEAGINNRRGGLCKTKHMKIKFEVHSDKSSSTDDFPEETGTRPMRPARPPQMSTPLLYIIHSSDSTSEGYLSPEEEDDDGGSSSRLPNCYLLLLTILLCLLRS